MNKNSKNKKQLQNEITKYIVEGEKLSPENIKDTLFIDFTFTDALIDFVS